MKSIVLPVYFSFLHQLLSVWRLYKLTNYKCRGRECELRMKKIYMVLVNLNVYEEAQGKCQEKSQKGGAVKRDVCESTRDNLTNEYLSFFKKSPTPNLPYTLSTL